ncbi:MAG: AAA family ATPase [Candidatus Woesearchaeota archaeon]
MGFYVIIRGPLGCGKTTLSERLSSTINATCFHVDKILEEHGLEDEWEEGYISIRSFIKANQIITPKIRVLLDKGSNVIIEGNFYYQSQIDDLISRIGYPHYVFTLHVPLNTCILRDNNRVNPHGEDATRAVYKKTTEFDYGIIIDADNDIDDCINSISSHLPPS